jgi:hypothetical protein
MDDKWDVFISHASEDKDAFARPLAETLRDLGVRVWFDEFSLNPGDSLSRSIDKGIAGSNCGLVIVSQAFIAKKWPERELRGLVARQIATPTKIIPVWYGVTSQEVLDFSPPLHDTYAIIVTEGKAVDAEAIQNAALKILKEVRPDLYDALPRTELAHKASEMFEYHVRVSGALHVPQAQFSGTAVIVLKP